MIRVGIVGGVDPRVSWFLAAAQRRRAGVRIVGLSEPDPKVRDDLASRYDLPSWDDHRAMLDEATPSLIAVARPDAGPVVIDALRHGADVLVAPPICDTLDQLATISELAASHGRRVTAALTYRGHPAARTAAELVERLGRLELLSLILGGEPSAAARRLSIMEGVDLFQWLTGTTAEALFPIGEGHPARNSDPADLREAFGELIFVADTGAATPAFEVRHQPDLTDRPAVIQLYGEAGAIEWDPRTGTMRSSFDGRDPITVSCGRPEQPEWVLNNLIRRSQPVISTDYSLDLMRLLLSAEASLRS